MDSRQLLRSFARGGVCPRPPLLATAFYHAARMAGSTFEGLFADPSRLTRALLDQQTFFNADAIAVRVDPVVFAHGCGAQTDWDNQVPVVDWSTCDSKAWPGEPDSAGVATAVLVDVADRLVRELRRKLSVMAVVPSPARLAGVLNPEGAGRAATIVRNLVDSFGKVGVGLIVIETDTENLNEASVHALLSPIINTAHYYNAMVFVTAPDPAASKLGDGLILPASARDASADSRVGLTVPPACFDDPIVLAEFAAAIAARREACFLTVPDETLLAHSAEHCASVMQTLRNIAFS